MKNVVLMRIITSIVKTRGFFFFALRLRLTTHLFG